VVWPWWLFGVKNIVVTAINGLQYSDNKSKQKPDSKKKVCSSNTKPF
jgi:hypothetical protein